MARATESAAERRKLDARLDEALTQTFPASDPFSVGHFTATEPPSRPVDRKPPRMRKAEARVPRPQAKAKGKGR
jgi:hypothetical protein